MSKAELLKEYRKLLDAHKMTRLDGIHTGSTKSEIQHGIDCLKCDEETLEDYLTVIKHAFPATHEKIVASNYKKHAFNRLYVFQTARMILGVK